jgi:putative holliday junction resolvase
LARIASIDYGKAKIGLALSDESQFIATPKGYLQTAKTLEETARLLYLELSKWGKIESIVIGLPLTLAGKETEMTGEIRKLAELLHTLFNLPIHLWDERLSTAQVERTLKEAEFNRKKRSQLVDAMAAAAILQNFLDAKA